MNLLQDLRYALRTLWKSPTFTVVALLTLALGIGVNTAIFTVVHAALLRPLPYAAPERLVHLYETKAAAGEFSEHEASYPNFRDWQASAPAFSSIAGYSPSRRALSGEQGAEQVPAGLTTGEFFSTLGVSAALGRLYGPAEDRKGAPRVVVLSHEAWQRRYGADPGVLGRSVTLDGEPHVVIGVLPARFHFAAVSPADYWMPVVPEAGDGMVQRRNLFWLRPVARLAPGVTLAAAQAQLGQVAQRLAQEHPASNGGSGVRVAPLREALVGPVRPLLLVLLGAVGLVLLIACVNVANLLLARSTGRQKEFAIRLALGASRGRVVQQLLTESVVLAALGGLAGLVCAQWTLEGLLSLIPALQRAQLPYLQELGLDGPVLLFTAGVALLTGVLFGLAPALLASRPELHGTLKGEGRGLAGPARTRLRSTLVVAEMALALVLVVGAGLLLKSLVRMANASPGFEAQGLLALELAPPGEVYDTDAKALALQAQLTERLGRLPGVKGVALVSQMPATREGNTIRFVALGRPAPPPGEEAEANIRSISANYFSVMGVPLARGRAFGAADVAEAPQVVVINQTLAARLFPGQDAVGQRIRFTFAPDQPAREVVGVVGDEKVGALDHAAAPVLYTPMAQDTALNLGVALRVEREDAVGLVGAVRSELRSLDPGMVVSGLGTMAERMDAAPWMFLRRFPTLLVGMFAALALVLAMVGVYGVIAYSVGQRVQELGVRLALGAQRAQVQRLVVGQGLTVALLGVALGALAAVALGQLLQSQLFEVSAADPAVLLGGSAVLLVVALLASWLPARRASRVDPAVALR